MTGSCIIFSRRFLASRRTISCSTWNSRLPSGTPLKGSQIGGSHSSSCFASGISCETIGSDRIKNLKRSENGSGQNLEQTLALQLSRPPLQVSKCGARGNSRNCANISIFDKNKKEDLQIHGIPDPVQFGNRFQLFIALVGPKQERTLHEGTNSKSSRSRCWHCKCC